MIRNASDPRPGRTEPGTSRSGPDSRPRRASATSTAAASARVALARTASTAAPSGRAASARAASARALFIALTILMSLGLAAAACSSDCDGRVIDGVCQTRCRDDLCPTGYRCLFNACRAPCSSRSDCPSEQDCKRVVTDANETARLCTGGEPQLGNGSEPDLSTGQACDDNSDCDPDFGVLCVEDTCTLTCEVHDHCPGGSCTGSATDAAGDSVYTCEPDDLPRSEGQFGTPCPGGDECDTDAGFTCVGAGPGDIDAYCTATECSADADCPTGYFCAAQRAGVPPCSDSCEFSGSNEEGCVPDSEIGPGKRYECGTVGLRATVCLKREFCNECETDADCRAHPDQICARDRSGTKICTVLCDPDVNSCPWGSAAVCGLWDEELGRETCAHRFGSCQGEGQSCEPCVDEADCPKGFCQESQFSGERYCVDLSVDCSCPAGTADACLGGGCPLTPAPANRPMSCFGGQRFAGSVLENKCFGGGQLEAGEPTGCWPAF